MIFVGLIYCCYLINVPYIVYYSYDSQTVSGKRCDY